MEMAAEYLAQLLTQALLEGMLRLRQAGLAQLLRQPLLEGMLLLRQAGLAELLRLVLTPQLGAVASVPAAF